MNSVSFKRFTVSANTGEAISKEYWDDDGDVLLYTAGQRPIKCSYDAFPSNLATTDNDILVARNGAGAVSIPENGSVYTDHVIRFVLQKSACRKYLYYALLVGMEKVVAEAVQVSLKTLSKSAWDIVPIPKHTISMQERIAAYLDRRTAEIDTLLVDLARQAEMLNRYKRELIAEAVTKGLDKSVPIKDSGVDWIGDAPFHWAVTKMKWMFEIVKRIYGKEDRDVLSITQRGLKVKDIENNEGQLAESYANYQVVNVNDFAMNSMDLLTGWVDCSPFEGVTSPDYRVFRFLSGKEQCHNYYKYLFQMCYKSRIFYRLGQGVSNLGRWRLQADQFLNMKLPQPPISEQREIAAYLDEKTVQVDSLMVDINAQIEKLKQYRQIVIHDAVTGKIKVTEG